jgi:hypothetical protein
MHTEASQQHAPTVRCNACSRECPGLPGGSPVNVQARRRPATSCGGGTTECGAGNPNRSSVNSWPALRRRMERLAEWCARHCCSDLHTHHQHSASAYACLVPSFAAFNAARMHVRTATHVSQNAWAAFRRTRVPPSCHLGHYIYWSLHTVNYPCNSSPLSITLCVGAVASCMQPMQSGGACSSSCFSAAAACRAHATAQQRCVVSWFVTRDLDLDMQRCDMRRGL